MTGWWASAPQRVASRIERELADPGSPWRVRFPDTATLCERYGVGGRAIGQALGVLGARGVLVPRWTRGGDPPMDRPRWVPPAQAGPAHSVAARLAHQITTGRLTTLPSPVRLALECGVDRAAALWALHRLVAWGLATPTRRHRAAPWGWVLTTHPRGGPDPGGPGAEPTACEVAAELARRLRSGWYEWTGCDGRRYTRPFPNVERLAAQFGCTPDTAEAALRSLGVDIAADTGHPGPDPTHPATGGPPPRRELERIP